MNPRVWFKSISLENVRSFGTKQTINFTDKDGNAARWNVILGDNGTGKTTILRVLFAIIGRESEIDHLTNEYSYFLRREDIPVAIDSLIEFNDRDSVSTKTFTLEINLLGYHSKFSDKREYSPFPFLKIDGKDIGDKESVNIPIYGYGASRRMSATESLSKESGNTYQSLFSDDVGLLDVESWILRADYMAYRNKNLRRRYDLIESVLLRLFRGEILELNIGNVMGLPKVFFKTHYGDVRLHELSLGYKTLIAWMVDFAKGLLDRHPDSEDPLSEPAVCLVDEIDLHLHPKFQRTIIKFLTETFPNTQFIVTAHSPLIVVAAEERPLDANIILLKREGDQTVVVNDPVDVNNWSVDQILNSDLFGLEDKPAKLRRERDNLLRKTAPTKKEQARLQVLNDELDGVPFSTDPAEIKADTIITQLAAALRSRA